MKKNKKNIDLNLVSTSSINKKKIKSLNTSLMEHFIDKMQANQSNKNQNINKFGTS